jgi:hypothetical protein
MVVKLDADILYWHDLSKGWTHSENMASKYPKRAEAEAKALFIVSTSPELIGKLHVRDFYGDGFASMEQGELFE